MVSGDSRQKQDSPVGSDDEDEEDYIPLENITTMDDLLEQYGGIDGIWTPLNGAAFYSKVCKINHSCEPNIVVTYRMTPSEGLVAVVQALKEIKCNDELLHSYIDNTDDRETRKTALKEYGFDCHCNKCQKECNE